MTTLMLKLLLAHFLGDFALQPIKWVEHKKAHTYRSKYLYGHMGVHALLLLLILQFRNLWAIAIVVFSHYVIDLLKLMLTTPKNYRWLFVVDQLLHLAVIALVVYIKTPYQIDFSLLFSKKTIALATCIVFVTFVTAVIIKMLLTTYIKEIAEDDTNDGTSLKDAGRYIGMLERVFVFGFILAD